jgi:hypothetical protein
MYRQGPKCLQGPVAPGRLRREQTGQGGHAEANGNAEGEVRHELVARVRRVIAAGNYDTTDRWEIALDRLGQRLGLR